MKTLVIDRVKLFQEIISEVLRDTEIEPVFAHTGKEALEILAAEKFECICLSLYLDDTDGIALCQKIRKVEEFRYTPIVLISSETSPEIIKRAMSLGITDTFSKNKIHELVNFIERFSKNNNPISGRVLYIEDNQSQRDYIAAFLRSRGLEVDAYADAQEAFDSFLKHHYHLVVTDIVLEGEVSGVLLINKIRRLDGKKGDIPILAVTAFDNISRRISLFHMGVTDYVIKPIIQEELIARVSNLIFNQKSIEK